MEWRKFCFSSDENRSREIVMIIMLLSVILVNLKVVELVCVDKFSDSVFSDDFEHDLRVGHVTDWDKELRQTAERSEPMCWV